VYLIEIDPECALDTPSFWIRGIPKSRFDYIISAYEPEVLNVHFINQEFMFNVSRYLQMHPHASQLQLETIQSIEPLKDETSPFAFSNDAWQWTIILSIVAFLITLCLLILCSYFKYRGWLSTESSSSSEPNGESEGMITPNGPHGSPLNRILNVNTYAEA
jgi:hypothetical protein